MSKPYEVFWITDINNQSGQVKRRKIYQPTKETREVQIHFLAHLERVRPLLPSATGSMKGNSPLRNVLRHKRGKQFAPYFYLLDIKGAFESVKMDRLAGILRQQDPDSSPNFYSDFLRLYCTSDEGGLVTGGNSSPILFNIYCEFMIDRKLRKVAKEYCCVYSRYSDDLTFSSIIPIGATKRRKIRQVIIDGGFEINHKKSQVLDLRYGPITVNGISFDQNGKIFFPKIAADNLVKRLNWAIKQGGKLESYVRKELQGQVSAFEYLSRNRRLNRVERRIVQLSGILFDNNPFTGIILGKNPLDLDDSNDNLF